MNPTPGGIFMIPKINMCQINCTFQDDFEETLSGSIKFYCPKRGQNLPESDSKTIKHYKTLSGFFSKNPFFCNPSNNLFNPLVFPNKHPPTVWQ